MSNESDATTDGGTDSPEIDRRRALKRFGLAAGTAAAAPLVVDSFLSPASAAGTTLTPDVNGQVTVPRNRILNFTLNGAGGGGGNKGRDRGGNPVTPRDVRADRQSRRSISMAPKSALR